MEGDLFMNLQQFSKMARSIMSKKGGNPPPPLTRDRRPIPEEIISDECIFVGYTNGHQILNAASDEGIFYKTTDNECFIPLYMHKRHEHRLRATSNMQVTLDKVKAAQAE